MNLRVMNDHVLVLLVPPSDRTTSGILVAPMVPSVSTQGRVVRVGPKVSEVQPGDMVAFPPEVGVPITLSGGGCLFLRESDITAIVPKREGVSA